MDKMHFLLLQSPPKCSHTLCSSLSHTHSKPTIRENKKCDVRIAKTVFYGPAAVQKSVHDRHDLEDTCPIKSCLIHIKSCLIHPIRDMRGPRHESDVSYIYIYIYPTSMSSPENLGWLWPSQRCNPLPSKSKCSITLNLL